MPRPRGVEFRRFPASRRVVTGALRVGRRAAPIHGLLQVDVTEAWRRSREREPPLSFTAYIVACAARAAARHPEAHAYRDWRGRLVVPRYVDVGLLIETPTPTGTVPVGHVVRDADTREVADISAEIRAIQRDPASGSSRPGSGRFAAAARLPGAAWLFFRLARGSVRIRGALGTVAVSSVGMFGEGGGFVIGLPTVVTLNVFAGGASERAAVVAGQVRVRRLLDLTVTVDHSVVDGAPAARFAASLRELLESAETLPDGPHRER